MPIFDEKKRAEKILKNGFTKFMHGPDVVILAKYYRTLGKTTKEVEDMVIEFCKEHEPEFNETLFYDKIHENVLLSAKYPLKEPVLVKITKNEIEKIRSLKNYRYEKILFVLLAYAKYRKVTNTNVKELKSKNYSTHEKFGKIIRLAHVSRKKGENIERNLFDLGMISYNKVYDLFYICFTDTEDISETFVVIDDMDDILKFYPPYCLYCGESLEKRSNRNQMHVDCWKEKRKEDKRNWIKNCRQLDQELLTLSNKNL